MLLTCPSCPGRFHALWPCHDGKHRCWNCREKLPAPVVTSAALATTPGPKEGVPYKSPYTTKATPITKAAAAIRRKIRDIESVKNWRKSESKSAAHFAYTDALGILRGAGE